MVYKLQIEILHPMSTTPFPITLLAIPHVLLITVCTGINQSVGSRLGSGVAGMQVFLSGIMNRSLSHFPWSLGIF